MHNLEHGYTVVWYRDGAPSRISDALRAIAKTFTSEDYDPDQKFIAAPWTETDGGAVSRTGKNVVLTPLDRRPERPGRHHQAEGVRQPCAAVSGQAIKDFMAKYPMANSPEPNGA